MSSQVSVDNNDSDTSMHWTAAHENAQQEEDPKPPPLWSRTGCSLRLQTLWSQLCWAEISGSLGDLGTFLPLLIALSVSGSVSFAPALFWYVGMFTRYSLGHGHSIMSIRIYKSLRI
jgi:hypothetical protein